ncbi:MULTISPECIES: secretin N-terminal domain-containing protein [unclassified Polaromonas]|uniref:secretin N-terminal domain-containing protein n=1 Tax=unclassified Polaromonas TaxID=2638319 RepID=UPI000F0970F9|nr:MULTISPECIES: secretin N-terminal domain-containing protein [unclassified Polaromonas]AYQ29518.1 secretion protein [Polaromonas sp. SP1]QGJ19367.1 secretion protein [Polaromonas sp. Pch-P]
MTTIERNAGPSESGEGAAHSNERRQRLTQIASGVLTCLLLTACAGARYHADGMSQIGEGNIDSGIASLKKATELDDGNQYYKIDYLVQRDKHADAFVKQADQVRASGDIAGARDLYGRALTLNPSNSRAATALKALDQDTRNDQLLLEGERYLKDGRLEAAGERAARVLAEQPGNKRAAQLRKAVLDVRAAAEVERDRFREAKSVMGSPVTLQFRDAAMRTVFEALSKSTGLNILLDRDVKADARVTIFVKDVAVEDAIELILMQNQLEKRIVNSNTMMIYPATAGKQSEYQELTVRSFRVTNTDLKYLAGMLKTMLKLKEVSADDRSGLLVIRDTPETLRIAEKLIALHDEPDPEVMLEVEVLEISEGRNSNLGVLPPSAITIGTPNGGATTPGGTVSSLTIGQLRQLGVGGLTVSPISGTLNFKLQDTETKILASPRIRARNREKAKIMIGDRVPTIINNVTPVNGGSSVVTGTVTYQDVGLKLEFEPQVYGSSDVGIKINLEVSNIAREFTDTQGSRSYQIGTRNASTFLRLADGETQILGGLITDEERNTADKIPGLGHLPVVGRLFGNSGTNKSRSEIVLAITPRILRNYADIGYDRANVFSGTALTLRDRQILGDPVGGLSLPNSAPGTRSGPAVAPVLQAPGAPSPDIPIPLSPPAMQLSGSGLPPPPPMIKR